MKNGFKIQQEHNFQDFTIYEIVSPQDSIVTFKMCRDQVSIGTYYDGSMVITDAANALIIGWVLEGWQCKPELDTERSWYTCKVEKEMKNWLCVHSSKFTKCDIKGDGEPSATVNGISFWLS